MKKKKPVPCIWPGCPTESEYKIENKPYCHGHIDAFNLNIKLKNALADLTRMERELKTCKEAHFKITRNPIF